MGTKPNKQRHQKNKQNKPHPFELFLESQLQKSLIELVNAKSWPRRYIALGRVKTLADVINFGESATNNEYKKLISVTFRRVR